MATTKDNITNCHLGNPPIRTHRYLSVGYNRPRDRQKNIWSCRNKPRCCHCINNMNVLYSKTTIVKFVTVCNVSKIMMQDCKSAYGTTWNSSCFRLRYARATHQFCLRMHSCTRAQPLQMLLQLNTSAPPTYEMLSSK